MSYKANKLREGKELETKRPEETTDKRMSRQTDRQTDGAGGDRQTD